MITYPVVEKFVSINGEGQKAGEIAAFIRMRGCNLACNYCDTSWANTKDCPCEFLSAEELITWLKEHSIENVTLTGGEPLLTEEIAPLIEALGSTDLNLLVDVGFNKEVAEDCALYWSRKPGSLAKLIDKADQMSADQIAEMGRRAKKRVAEEYTWDKICGQYADVFTK